MNVPLIDHLPAAAETLWFLFAFTFVDAFGLPIASTVLMAYLGTRHPPLAVALVGAGATAAGSVAQYLVVRWLLRWEQHLPGALRRLRRRLEIIVAGAGGATFWALFVIYATPLAAGPLRLIAAATGYSLSRFALAIGLGCIPYYFVLAWIGHTIRLPLWAYAACAGVLVAGSLAVWLVQRRRNV